MPNPNRMSKESFMMISLEDDKAKEIAQVLSNEKCRKIIDYMTENDSVTETQISKALDIPLSTVHYNIKQLVKNNLVVSEEYHYSKKGKQVQHYSLANKYIIISPKPVYGIKQKLRNILPVALIVGAVAVVIRISGHFFTTAKSTALSAGVRTQDMASYAKDFAEEAVMEAAPAAKETVTHTAAGSPLLINLNVYILWFLIGAVFSIAVYLFIDWLRKRPRKL